MKQWRVFQNKKESSPTSFFRRHLNKHHALVWKQECQRLNIPVEDQVKEALPEPTSGGPGAEPFTKDGLMRYMIRFISSNDQVRDVTLAGRNLC